MNTAQLMAVRKMARVFDEARSFEDETMSARQMALISHDLTHSGDQAKLEDGSRWTWDCASDCWVASYCSV